VGTDTKCHRTEEKVEGNGHCDRRLILRVPTTTTTTTNTTTTACAAAAACAATTMTNHDINSSSSSSSGSSSNADRPPPPMHHRRSDEEMVQQIMNRHHSVDDHQYHHHHPTTNTTTMEDHERFHAMVQPALVGYRSVGIGVFGATMRYIGMPLEKIALYINSSQVSVETTTTTTTAGSRRPPSQFQQAIHLTFREGMLAPYRVVGPASIMAWFLQYSVMGIAFQFFDQMLSNMLQVRPMYYGRELMEPPPTTVACTSESSSSSSSSSSASYYARETLKTIASPFLAACLESYVSNRAEVQRFFGGPQVYAQMERLYYCNQQQQQQIVPAMVRYAGPAYAANVGRNIIMCQTSFVLTPYTYKMYFPQDYKNKSTLFYYGLSLNIFIGNVLAITQQALWGRSLDYFQQHHHINYTKIIQEGYQKEGIAAFFTTSKWFSRVLMNAPAQGTLPWFYNEILPLGEYTFLLSFYKYMYTPFLRPPSSSSSSSSSGRVVTKQQHQQHQSYPAVLSNIPMVLAESTMDDDTADPPNAGGGRPCNVQRTRTHYGTLPTANPEFDETESERNRPPPLRLYPQKQQQQQQQQQSQ
jgi:hypothetical protein